MKKTLRERIEMDKAHMQNSKSLGEKKGKQLLEDVSYYLMLDSNEHASESINTILFEELKNPEEMIEHAFARSFGSYNYEAAYKYVRDVVQYCIEVAKQMTREQINSVILAENNELRNKLNSFNNLMTTFNSTVFNAQQGHQYTVYSFFNQIATYIDGTDLKGNFFRKSVKSIIDVNIENIEHFMESFQKTFGRSVVDKQEEIISRRVDDLKKMAENSLSSNLKKFLGCKAKCPGCGAKCNKDTNHTGGHSSIKHIYNGFFGWHNPDTNVVSMKICWEKKLFIDSIVHSGIDLEKQKYNGLKDFLTQKHPNWLNDVEENFKKYGQNQIGIFKLNIILN